MGHEMREEINKFRDFLKENSEEKLNISDVSDSLNILSDYFYDNGFLTKMYIKDKDIYLMDFKRGNSTLSGTDVMKMITEFADKNNLNIKLVASPLYMEQNKLISFYKKFGFQIIGDYYNMGKEMIRYSNYH
jgi:hypothetical protein